MNETGLKRTYTKNRLKRFKTKSTKDSSIEQVKICEILNTTFESLVKTIEKQNIVNENI